MRQGDREPRGPQRIHRPVPAVGGLDRDRRTRSGPADHLDQGRDRVLDPDALEDLTLTIHSHDHTATTMQIDPDILTRLLIPLVHGGLSLTVGYTTIRGSSDHPPSGRPAPAPSSHHFGADPRHAYRLRMTNPDAIFPLRRKRDEALPRLGLLMTAGSPQMGEAIGWTGGLPQVGRGYATGSDAWLRSPGRSSAPVHGRTALHHIDRRERDETDGQEAPARREVQGTTGSR